jgi:hypothetical protein
MENIILCMWVYGSTNPPPSKMVVSHLHVLCHYITPHLCKPHNTYHLFDGCVGVALGVSVSSHKQTNITINQFSILYIFISCFERTLLWLLCTSSNDVIVVTMGSALSLWTTWHVGISHAYYTWCTCTTRFFCSYLLWVDLVVWSITHVCHQKNNWC